MFIQRSFPRQHGIGFGVRRLCRALGMRTPVIEHAGYVMNLFGFNAFNAAQSKIVVLRTFQTLSKTTDFIQKVSAIDPKMRDQIVRVKQVHIPVTLEVRIEPFAASSILSSSE